MNECSSWQLGTNVYDLGYGELSGVVQVNTLYMKQIFSEEEYCSLGKNLNNLFPLVYRVNRVDPFLFPHILLRLEM